jgi:hypothetical protein
VFVEDIFDNYKTPVYERKTAPKNSIVQENLWVSDTTSFGTRVGFITNIATECLAMLELYPENSEEHSEILNRLKFCNCLQSMSIDAAKGIEVMSVPESWTKWNKVDEGASEEEKHLADLYNRILCLQRPYFMRYVYPATYGKKYKKHVETHENLSQLRLGKSLSEVLDPRERTRTEEELEIYNSFIKFNPLLDTPSVMNRICHHVEKETADIKHSIKNLKDFDYSIYLHPDVALDERKLHEMKILLQKFSAHRKSSRENINDWEDGGEEPVEEYWKELRRESYHISSNAQELANLAIEVCYGNGRKGSKEFCWKLFGEEICENLLVRNMYMISVPVADKNGTIEYTGKKYSEKMFCLKEEEHGL